MIVTAALGALLLIVIVGIALFPVTYLFYRKRKRTERQINERTLEIESLKTELVALKSTLDVKLTPLTPEIFSELSSVHQVRAASSSSGSTVQMVRETIKEVVMVPCFHDHAAAGGVV
jgi:hypothetical protein